MSVFSGPLTRARGCARGGNLRARRSKHGSRVGRQSGSALPWRRPAKQECTGPCSPEARPQLIAGVGGGGHPSLARRPPGGRARPAKIPFTPPTTHSGRARGDGRPGQVAGQGKGHGCVEGVWGDDVDQKKRGECERAVSERAVVRAPHEQLKKRAGARKKTQRWSAPSSSDSTPPHTHTTSPKMPPRTRARSSLTGATTTGGAGPGGGGGDTSPFSTPPRPPAAGLTTDRDDTPPFEPAVSSGGRPKTRSHVAARAAAVTLAEVKKCVTR